VPLVTGLAESPVLTALELQDSWAVPDSQVALINRERFDLGLLIVKHHIPYYAERCPATKFLWTPHAVNPEVFRDYGLPKDYDVLLYGNVIAHTYPFRARLAMLLNRSDLRFRWLAHPGYYPPNGLQVPGIVAGADLAREINKAWIAISTSSIYRCVMMKYYEIAASGALIAGDMPDEGREIFGKDFLELRPEQTDEELLGAIHQALGDKKKLRARAKAAQKRIVRDYSTDAFAKRLLREFAAQKAQALRPIATSLRGGPMLSGKADGSTRGGDHLCPFVTT
jgi:hypothetical protein